MDDLLKSYEEAPYPSAAFPEMHPDSMATTAHLWGLRPPAVENCRFLEIGCGTGVNLLAMAAALPGSRFVGVDLSPGQIEFAREVAAQLGDTLGPSVVVRDWTRTNRNWFAAVQVEKRLMFIILTLIVAVAAFNLVSTLVMTVTDKRADIAILRTLGATPRSVMSIFMVQGALSGVIGTLAGVGGGLLIALNVDIIVPFIERLLHVSFLPSSVYLISKMPSDPQSGDIVPIAVISLVLSFLATLYPSWRASRVQPAEALRYE